MNEQIFDRNGNQVRFPGSVLIVGLLDVDKVDGLSEVEATFLRAATGAIAQVEQLIGGRVEIRLVNPQTRFFHYILSDPNNLEVVPR